MMVHTYISFTLLVTYVHGGENNDVLMMRQASAAGKQRIRIVHQFLEATIYKTTVLHFYIVLL